MARTLSFDPQQKLLQAMLIFMQYGFLQTRISQLLEKLAINKFSLYKQFGNKEALYQLVLEQYTERVFNPLISRLDVKDKGKAAIDDYLNFLAMQLDNDNARYGCLLMNTLQEGEKLPKELHQAALLQVKRLKICLRKNFEAAKKQGHLKQDVTQCVNFSLMCIQALLNTRKTQGKKALLENLEFFRSTLKNW